jgi:hypothetical protein
MEEKQLDLRDKNEREFVLYDGVELTKQINLGSQVSCYYFIQGKTQLCGVVAEGHQCF